MKVHYLEIVALDVDAVCAAYEAAHGIRFGAADPSLGGARTTRLPDGVGVGVRGPLRETETPIVRPYWLVDDIDAAVAAVSKRGALVAMAPLEIPGKGTFAIYIQGGVEHGLWQL
jgi:predicted enzyme related to lactoylglutathione lyase